MNIWISGSNLTKFYRLIQLSAHLVIELTAVLPDGCHLIC